ncbi:MAG TPA: alkaline phosphatase family protein, partial [Jatrophihabitans sp.]|nr:alkaline phosphatase family protein [Jatrophihabitans sp.]
MHRRALATLASAALVVAGLDGIRPAVASATASVPRPDHVVIVVEENKAAPEIVGNPDAPFITSLAAGGANFTSSYAITHPSQPNYIALFSGSPQGVTDDSCPHSFAAPSLGDELIAAGRTFTGYSESLPSAGYTGCSLNGYARKHNPWVDFPAIPASANQPFSAFPSDYSQLPDVSFVIPNLQNDMHDGTVAQGDAWLQANLGGYIEWAKTHNSLFVLTFDEDDNSAANRSATVFAGQPVAAGNYA